jgi:hypothetical protein
MLSQINKDKIIKKIKFNILSQNRKTMTKGDIKEIDNEIKNII